MLTSSVSPDATAPSSVALPLESIVEMVRKEEKYGTSRSDLYSDFKSASASASDGCEQNRCHGCPEDLLELRWSMCEWCQDTAARCGVGLEAVEVAMNLLDRAFARTTCGYKLAGVAALFVASKLRCRISSHDMAAATGHAFAAAQIVRAEPDLLKAVRWLVHPPTTCAIASCFVDFLAASGDEANAENLERLRDDVAYLCTEQTKLAVRDYAGFGQIRPFILALAALRNTCRALAIYDEQTHMLLIRHLLANDAIDPASVPFVYYVQRRLLVALGVQHQKGNVGEAHDKQEDDARVNAKEPEHESEHEREREREHGSEHGDQCAPMEIDSELGSEHATRITTSLAPPSAPATVSPTVDSERTELAKRTSDETKNECSMSHLLANNGALAHNLVLFVYLQAITKAGHGYGLHYHYHYHYES